MATNVAALRRSFTLGAHQVWTWTPVSMGPALRKLYSQEQPQLIWACIGPGFERRSSAWGQAGIVMPGGFVLSPRLRCFRGAELLGVSREPVLRCLQL